MTRLSSVLRPIGGPIAMTIAAALAAAGCAPRAGAALLVLAAALHWFAAAVLEPVMGTDPRIFVESMRLRSASMACLLACGALGAASGWTCYRKMGD